MSLSDSLRPLTTRERSLNQTFPPEFVLLGSQSAIEQMIGNAVPVKLAGYIGQYLSEFLADTVAGSADSIPPQQLSLF